MLWLVFSIVPPLLGFSFVFTWKDPVHWRKYIWSFVLMLMLLAYSFIPTTNADLSRYYLKVEHAGTQSFIEAVFGTKTGLYDGLYVINALVWIVAKLGCKGLLPALSVGIVYSVAFYITCDCAERYEKIEWIRWMLIIQFLLLPFYNIVNNIRNVIAFSFVALAAYRELIQGKRNVVTYILYLLPCFIHAFALTAILMRILSGLVKKNRILGILLVITGSNIIDLLYSNIYIFSSIPTVYNMIFKAHRYLSPDYSNNEWAIRVTTEAFYRAGFYANIFFGAILVFFLAIVIKHLQNTYSLKKNETVIVNWEFWIGVMILSSIPFSIPYYWRYATLAAICIGAVLVITNAKEIKIWAYVKWLFWGSAIAIAGLQFYELLLRALRTEWIEMFMLNNLFVILIEIIRNIII